MRTWRSEQGLGLGARVSKIRVVGTRGLCYRVHVLFKVSGFKWERRVEDLVGKGFTFENFAAMKFTAPMLLYFWQRSCCEANFIVSKFFNLKLFLQD